MSGNQGRSNYQQQPNIQQQQRFTASPFNPGKESFFFLFSASIL
jgi:hypothetical protein